MAKKNIGEAVVKLYNNNGGPLDGRTYFELEQSETVESLFQNLPSGYKIGEEITILLQNGTVEKYKVTGLERNYISNYELIQEPKDLKYSDNTSFLNSDNEIDIDTLKLKNIPELQSHPMLDGFYYTISNNTPWEGQILNTPIYHINNQYLEISIPSILSNPSNLGEFSQSLITTYSELEGKQLEISIFNINKCSNGYLSSNSSYKFKIPLDTTSDKTVIETEDGINLECGIGIQTNYQLTVSLPENEPNISDYRVVLSFSNIQDVNTKVHIKYAASTIPGSNDMHDSIQDGDLYIGIYSDNNSSDSTDYTDYKWSKIVGIDGKSAYQQWLEEGNTGDETDFLNSLKAYISKFIPIATESGATNLNIGDTYTFSSVSGPIDGAMLLMPNGDTTTPKTLMFSVSSNGDIPETFTYTYVGELNIDTSDFLNLSNVDSTNLSNPSSSQVAKAEDVMKLSVMLQGVNFYEEKIELIENTNYFDGKYINVDGYIQDSNSENEANAILCVSTSNVKYIRFLGFKKNGTNSAKCCYGFSSSDFPVQSENISTYEVTDCWEYDNGSDVDKAEEYIIPVPKDAKYFLCTIRKYGSSSTAVMTLSSFYCYLQYGDSIFGRLYGSDIQTKEKLKIDNQTNRFNIQFNKTTTQNAIGVQKSPTIASYKAWSLYLPTRINKGVTSFQVKRETPVSKDIWYTFINVDISTIDENLTVGELGEKGYLNSIHKTEDGWKPALSISDSSKAWINIPKDARRLIFTNGWYVNGSNNDVTGRCPDEVVFKYETHIKGDIESSINNLDENVKKIKHDISLSNIEFSNGYFNTDGSIVNDSKKAYSTPIRCDKPFFIELHEDYRMYRFHLFNNHGKMVTYYDRIYGDSSNTRYWGLSLTMPQYNEILVIRRADNKDIDVNDNIIKKFYNFDDCVRLIPENFSKTAWKNFHYRVNQVCNITWQAINDMVARGTSGSNLSSYYFKEGTWNRGVPYSEASSYSKYVGQYVSFRTLLTALLNKRSVMYTEDIEVNRRKSSYGINYEIGLAQYSSTYYGTVCTGFTSYVIGLPNVVTSSQWGNSSYTGMEKICEGNAQVNENTGEYTQSPYYTDSINDVNIDLENIVDVTSSFILPGDVIRTIGHCFVISDIYLDKEGEIKYVFCAEETAPRATITPYPVDKFLSRLKGYLKPKTKQVKENNTYVTKYYIPGFQIWRQGYAQWNERLAKAANFETDLPYIQMSKDDYTPQLLKIDPDITTYCGEYAAFTELDTQAALTSQYNNHKAFLNIRRGTFSPYTKLQIFNEEDDISNADPIEVSLEGSKEWISNDITINGNGIDFYYEDYADWIILDLKKMQDLNNNHIHLSPGKYKARVTNNIKKSGFTHFEIIKIEISPTENDGYNFACSGVPYMITREGSNTIGSSVPYLLNTDKTGYITPSGASVSSNEISYNSVNKTGTINLPSSKLSYYLKLYVRGDYGDVAFKVLTSGGTMPDETADSGEDQNTD